jgi:hypothetical protein
MRNIIIRIRNYIILFAKYFIVFIIKNNPYKKYAIEGDTYLNDGVWMAQQITEFDSLLEGCNSSSWVYDSYDGEYQNLRWIWSERHTNSLYSLPSLHYSNDDKQREQTHKMEDNFYDYFHKVQKENINKNLKKLEKKGVFEESFFSKKEHELIDKSYYDLDELLEKLREENYWKSEQDYRDLSYALDVIHDFYYRTK